MFKYFAAQPIIGPDSQYTRTRQVIHENDSVYKKGERMRNIKSYSLSRVDYSRTKRTWRQIARRRYYLSNCTILILNYDQFSYMLLKPHKLGKLSELTCVAVLKSPVDPFPKEILDYNINTYHVGIV